MLPTCYGFATEKLRGSWRNRFWPIGGTTAGGLGLYFLPQAAHFSALVRSIWFITQWLTVSVVRATPADASVPARHELLVGSEHKSPQTTDL